MDWLTGTCLFHKLKHEEAIERMEAESQRVLQVCALSGDKVEKATVLGFEGLKSEGFFFGRSPLGVMVRLSGHVAALEWAHFYPHLSNVTRVDCAVTIKLAYEDPNLSMVHWEEALEYQKKTAPKFKVVHIDGGKHGKSLLLGSRVSDSYGRIYDKYRESKLDQYRNCWRYEVEFKSKQATEVAYRMALAPEDLTVPVSIVYDWFQRRKVSPFFSSSAFSRYRVHRARTTVDRRLTWLYTQVGPAVRELIDQGYEAQVKRALFGDGPMQPTKSEDAQFRSKWRWENERMAKWEQE